MFTAVLEVRVFSVVLRVLKVKKIKLVYMIKKEFSQAENFVFDVQNVMDYYLGEHLKYSFKI